MFKGESHQLSHEIGHLAADHGSRRHLATETEEQEADYFAARLNGISTNRLKLYRLMGLILFCFNSPSLGNAEIEKEIKRLTTHHVPDDIIKRMTKIMGLRR